MNIKASWLILGVLMVTVAIAAGTAVAQGEDSPEAAKPKEVSLWSTIKAGGIIGLLVILMSLVSVALIVEHFFSIRRDRILPITLEQALEEQLNTKQYDQARLICDEDSSFLSKVVGAGLGQMGGMFGFFDMQTAMQEVSEREVSRLYRKLDYLAFIAATAPMLGLLGTVTGMIRSFNTIAVTEGAAKPSDLASGISEALVTTCMGLIVAIPAMFFVSQFRNRIDGYVAEAEVVVEKLMGRFRKSA